MSYDLNTPYSNRNLYIDSREGKIINNEYQFILTNPIICPKNCSIILKVLEVQIPNLLSNVTPMNNTLYISGSNTGSSTIIFETLYYNIDDFVLSFNAKSIAAGLDIQASYNPSLIKLSLKSLTQEFTIQNNSTMLLIGLNALNMTSVNGILQMPYMFNFSSEPFIFIKSNLNLRNLNSLGISTNILERVPISQPFGYKIIHVPNATSFLLHEKTIDKINIKFESTQGYQISFENNNFQIAMEFDYTYTYSERIMESIDHHFKRDINNQIIKPKPNIINKDINGTQETRIEKNGS